MTEEIIIDGVNVAGCEYYIQDYQRANNIEGRYEHCKDVCELNGDNYFYCKMNNDCYYKQLKRLEQENKNLKRQIESDKGLITVGGKQQYKYLQEIDKLQQENKELKETIKQYCEWLDEERESNEKLQKVYQNDHCDLLNYRFALEEIKELAKNGNAIDGIRLKIIDKINEALNHSEG